MAYRGNALGKYWNNCGAFWKALKILKRFCPVVGEKSEQKQRLSGTNSLTGPWNPKLGSTFDLNFLQLVSLEKLPEKSLSLQSSSDRGQPENKTGKVWGSGLKGIC